MTRRPVHRPGAAEEPAAPVSPGPASAPAVLTDVAYAPAGPEPGGRRLLDLYLPAGEGPWPLAVWVHGSGWLADNGRTGADEIAAALGPRGFAVAGVAIRSSHHARFPDQADDIRAAIDHLRDHAHTYRIDPGRIATLGESSGGWAAAMAGLTEGREEHVRAVVAIYPPTDLPRFDEQLAADGWPVRDDDPGSPKALMLGGPIRERAELAVQASPVTHVGPAAPAFMILHGLMDDIVPFGQSELLYHALAAAGRDVHLITLPHAQHGQWREFFTDPDVKRGASVRSCRGGTAAPARPADPTWDTVADFLRHHLLE